MKSVTRDMKFRQSLMEYTVKNGVTRAARKYNKSPSYIYFWKSRWDGSLASLACLSRRPHSHPSRPHSHPKQHTQEEIKLITDMRKRNPRMGLNEFWGRLRERGYKRRPESLFRVMRRQNMFAAQKLKKRYVPKKYEEMRYPGERVQVDVKVVPKSCNATLDSKFFQYTAIDEKTRMRFLMGFDEQSTYSSATFLKEMVAWFARRGVHVECVQTDNGHGNLVSINFDKIEFGTTY